MKQATDSASVNKLDPGLIAVVEALARQQAREDYARELARIEQQEATGQVP